MMVAIKPGHQGERGVSRKTIAQGRPDQPGEPVVTNSCVFYFTHEATGAAGTRLSLRPLTWRSNFVESLGRFAPRECRRVSIGRPHCCDGLTPRAIPSSVIPGWPEGPDPESITTAGGYGFRARRWRVALSDKRHALARGMTGRESHSNRLACVRHRRSKAAVDREGLAVDIRGLIA